MRKSLTLAFLGALGLLTATPHQIEAAAFTFDVGLGFALFSSDIVPFNKNPSGLFYKVGLGAHFDRRWSVQADLSSHSFSDMVGGLDLDLSNNLLEVTGRYYFGDIDRTVKYYAGGGVSFLGTSYRYDHYHNGRVYRYKESGTSVGLIALGGFEFGNEKHNGFAELGYRFYFTDPFDGADGSDWNNLPLVMGYRLKL